MNSAMNTGSNCSAEVESHWVTVFTDLGSLSVGPMILICFLPLILIVMFIVEGQDCQEKNYN